MKPYQTKEDAAEIGKRICAIRKSAGLTQEQLSEILDIGVGHMGKAERGKESLSSDVLLKFCQIFHVSPDELLLGKTPANSKPAVYSSKIPELLSTCNEMELAYCKILLIQTVEYLRKKEIASAVQK